MWEWERYPQYYIPITDVDPAALVDERHEQKLKRGTARRYGLVVGEVSRPAAMRVYGDDARFGLANRARFEWDAVDAWYEEDEQVFVHPRDPYTRVDALRSTRRVRVELDGTVLAESASPVMVFETGLPTRYYLNRGEVDFTRLTSRPGNCSPSPGWSPSTTRKSTSCSTGSDSPVRPPTSPRTPAGHAGSCATRYQVSVTPGPRLDCAS